MKFAHLVVAAVAASSAIAYAADTYTIDPNHTFPSFEADHFGISVWRGKFKKTTGTVTLDRKAKTGSVDINIDTASIDFGHDGLNAHAKKEDMFNVEKFPTATYKSRAVKFNGDVPVAVEGDLTLNGVTKPVDLTINRFKCIVHPMNKKDVCGADVSGEFNRIDFGIGTKMGPPTFSPVVKLAIQVEAVKQ